MDASEVLGRLAQMGNEGTARVLKAHGAKAPCYGVKIGDMKPLLKETGMDHDLAMDLFRSGVFDAMYLAGLAVDGATMTVAELQEWADTDYGSSISGSTVPWVASEHPRGWDLALGWIDSDRENIATTGWATLSALVSIRADRDLDLTALERLAARVVERWTQVPAGVQPAMVQFLASLGCSVISLTDVARAAAARLGPGAARVTTAIAGAEARGSLGKKKKTAKC